MDTGQIETLPIGPFVGILIGVLGAAVGVYCSLRSVKGVAERAFITSSVGRCCGLVIGFQALLLVLVLALPHPYKPWANLLWLVYIPGLIAFVPKVNRELTQIR